jgi:hypothetical protein
MKNNITMQENLNNFDYKKLSKIFEELLVHEKNINEFINSGRGKENVFNSSLNYINYITSLTILTEKSSRIKHPRNRIYNERDIICSMSFYIGDLDKEIIYDILKNDAFYKYETLHIVYVNLEFPSKLEYNTYEMFNCRSEKYKLHFWEMNYINFFKHIDIIKKLEDFKNRENEININPIIIFRGIHWGNICYLFKIHGFNLFGGTISNRHKLSIGEFKLSQFMSLIFSHDKKSFYNNYSEKLLTSNKYDKNLYNFIKENNYIDLRRLSHKSCIITEFLRINNKVNLEIELTELEEKIKIKKNELEEIKNKLLFYNDNLLDSNKEFEKTKKFLINRIKSESEELEKNSYISTKHRMNKKNKIDNLRLELQELNQEKKNNEENFESNKKKEFLLNNEINKLCEQKNNILLLLTKLKN